MSSKKTIRRPIELSGIGVHSGTSVHLALRPSESGSIIFRRLDLGGAEMGLALDRVESFNSTTLIGASFKVRTIEHLLAALYAFGISSVAIEVDADEMPILDGSALPFARMIGEAGVRDIDGRSEALRIIKPLTVEEKGAWIRLEPNFGEEGLVLDYAIDYDHPAIGNSRLALPLTPEIFLVEIAPARTFGFLKDVEWLHGQGLALGASFENTIVLDDTGIVNPPLRFPDEFVRHKLLDITGDLALLGRPLLGRVTAFKAGHRLHLECVRRLLASPDRWTVS